MFIEKDDRKSRKIRAADHILVAGCNQGQGDG